MKRIIIAISILGLSSEPTLAQPDNAEQEEVHVSTQDAPLDLPFPELPSEENYEPNFNPLYVDAGLLRYPNVAMQGEPYNDITPKVSELISALDKDKNCPVSRDFQSVKSKFTNENWSVIDSQIQRWIYHFEQRRKMSSNSGPFGAMPKQLDRSFGFEELAVYFIDYTCSIASGENDQNKLRGILYSHFPDLQSESQSDSEVIESHFRRVLGPVFIRVTYDNYIAGLEVGGGLKSVRSWDGIVGAWIPMTFTLGEYSICNFSLREITADRDTAFQIHESGWDSNLGEYDYRSLWLNIFAESNHRDRRRIILGDLEISLVQIGLGADERMAIGCTSSKVFSKREKLTLQDARRVRGDMPSPRNVARKPAKPTVTWRSLGDRLEYTFSNDDSVPVTISWQCTVFDRSRSRRVWEGNGTSTINGKTVISNSVDCANKNADPNSWKFEWDFR